MKEKINFPEVPNQYPMCLNRECNKADTCLRQLVEQNVPADIPYWNIISPKHLATQDGPCPYYRPATKVQFSKGFIRFLNTLPHKLLLTVTSQLTAHFGRRTYFRIRKGERLLSPAEQQQLLAILKNCGVSDPLEFDAYIESYDW